MPETIRYPAGYSGEPNNPKRQRVLTMHNKKCFYGDEVFPSMLKLASKLGVSKPTISRAIKKGEYKGVKCGLFPLSALTDK
jgi:DNA-binding MarR family transcriptional regulator